MECFCVIRIVIIPDPCRRIGLQLQNDLVHDNEFYREGDHYCGVADWLDPAALELDPYEESYQCLRKQPNLVVDV